LPCLTSLRRNILVNADGSVKIADFGLSAVASDDMQASHLPIRWTAPEALLTGKHVPEKSDVFSFGATSWEAFELGRPPWHWIRTNKEVTNAVISGQILPRPDLCPESVYDVLVKCWEPDPAERIGLDAVRHEIEVARRQLLEDNDIEESFLQLGGGAQKLNTTPAASGNVTPAYVKAPTGESEYTSDIPGATPEGEYSSNIPGATPVGNESEYSSNIPGGTTESEYSSNIPGGTTESEYSSNIPGGTAEGDYTSNIPGGTAESDYSTNIAAVPPVVESEYSTNIAAVTPVIESEYSTNIGAVAGSAPPAESDYSTNLGGGWQAASIPKDE
jgi:serine/threonine protein kinase